MDVSVYKYIEFVYRNPVEIEVSENDIVNYHEIGKTMT